MIDLRGKERIFLFCTYRLSNNEFFIVAANWCYIVGSIVFRNGTFVESNEKYLTVKHKWAIHLIL